MLPDAASLLPRCTFPAAGTPVVCAFSGGPDSTALLLLAVAAGCDVTAVHVDHGLRPTSSTEAAAAVGLAAAIGVPCDVARVAVADGPNLEARARDARRAVLPAGVLTGHTADDRAATLLVNLLRGAGATAWPPWVPPPRARSSTSGGPRPRASAPRTTWSPSSIRATTSRASCATASATSCSR